MALSSTRRWFRVAGWSLGTWLVSLVARQASAMVPGALRIRAPSEHYLIMYHASIAQGGWPATNLDDMSSAERFLSHDVLESCHSNA